MKQTIPINVIGGGDSIAPCLPAHYFKAGWHDFDPTSNIPHLAILEIMEEPQIKIAATIDSGIGEWPTRQDDKVYDTDGISPAIAVCRTNHVPNIMEEPKIMQIGSYVPNSACSGRVVNPDGLAPTVMENHGNITAVVEPAILSPIRTEEQRQLRKQGIDTFSGRQMLPRTDGVSDTITTVQKDNLLQEPIKIRQATAQGYIECPPGGGFDAAYPNSKLRRGRVQENGDVVGVITASADGHCVYEGAELSILGYTRDDKGKVVNYHEKGIAGSLHTSTGSGGNTDQFVKEQVIGSMQVNAMRGSIDGVSPCLTEAMGMGGGQIPMVTEASGIYDNQFGQFAREPIEGMARTLKADHHNAVLLRYRIRKLTERECFRLMDVSDSDIDKIEAHRIKITLKNGTVKEKPIPKSAKYKLAGNSIVVSCLYHIFHQMFIAEPPEPKPIQKSLFDL